ncbi:UBP-type zinc finger domain-containing protein [Streptomyces sp. RY43-2]|uniref:UBP-type zinc finger domain-containing protein n=1 Tax=Streptomyces macrolidinus TaxID=2952607 RepID=A0ABT0Z9W8_9ACTN|nr:UBP-type zinc finger domain-containing protein [Streptomyces macrolidinus]MCN9240047.1 UBP-type zinc finger domain-containing protein [Streptomyces macrolidinus]
MKQCTHIDALPRPEPAPRSETCLECLAAGTDPVQLRLCLECGHVACCDSSPLRHATAHYEDSGHPVMRTFEPGESWRWCFVDHGLV